MRRALVPLSDHPYYLWQALVQAVWMKEHGWPATFLIYCHGKPSERLRALMGAGLADWNVWADWRAHPVYNAAMKPALVGKYLMAHPEEADAGVLVLDPDALPLRPWLEPEPGVLHSTDTDSYTGPDYLIRKGAWDPLCRLVGVDADHAATFPGIGAQYVFTGISGQWWEKVAEISVRAFRFLETIPAPPGEKFPVQAWCAEMYVTQLLAIRDGIEPRMEPSMSMTWANGEASDWETYGFHHSAGVTAENGHDFCKITHQVSPWGKDLVVDPTSSSAPYVEAVNHVAKKYPHLVW